jgi:phospholipase A1
MRPPLIVAAAMLAGGAAAADNTTLADCRAVTDDHARLACYDAIAGQAAARSVTQPETRLVETTIATSVVDAEDAPDDEYLPPRLYEEEANANNRFVIIPHERNYLLPITYNSNINEEAWHIAHPGTGMDQAEVKFQLSMKAIVWQDILGRDINLWGAYTQTSWMQAYNTDASSPFRETDYEPELILSIANDWRVLGMRNTRVNIHFNHQSNGQSEPLSRSWNRAILSGLFERRNFSLEASAWYRIPERSKDDDNPDIDDYLGNGQLQGLWKWTDYSLGFTLRNNLSSDNKGAIQLDWTFPISQRFSGYIQYFNGYGESLIDYDESTNRIGIGVSLTDPL